MITFGEFVRWVIYRVSRAYYSFVRRLMRGDRLLWGSEAKFRALLEAAPDAMMIVDSHGHIALVNAQAERLFGYRRQELIGRGISELIPKRLRAQHRHHVKQYGRDATTRPMGSDLELYGLRRDGTEFPVEISLSPIDTDQGMMISSAIRDITARKLAVALHGRGRAHPRQRRADLGRAAGHDDRRRGRHRSPLPHPGAGHRPPPPLRGEPPLPRHPRPVHGAAQPRELRRPARRPRRPRASLRLRRRAAAARPRPLQVRQRHARPPGRGDQVIARVAKVLASRLRDSDVLARLGGDEFAALLPRATVATAKRVAEDLLEALRAERIAVPGANGRAMTASIGVAMFDASADLRGENVLVNADVAMYDAKEAGRNQLALHVDGEHAQARMRGRITWAERIRVAIDESRFELVAQPIIELATGAVTQFEVLLRMRNEQGDLIPPAAFLATAERLGMIQEIDAMAVAQAIRGVAAAGGGPAAPRVEINLSGVSMGDPGMLRTIEHELRETGLDPSRVIFEITETAAIANIGRAREFSDELARLGCHFALDDFGAGFGSFYYLKHVHFDILKIDGEFVRDCRSSTTDRLVIKAVVDIALGKQTVAEHVGDDETVTLLRGLGVSHGQGFHLGEPQALERFLADLRGAPGRAAAQLGLG